MDNKDANYIISVLPLMVESPELQKTVASELVYTQLDGSLEDIFEKGQKIDDGRPEARNNNKSGE